MEFNTIYLSEDILDKIYTWMPIVSLLKFSLTNRYTYQSVYPKIKQTVYSTLYKNYTLFKWMINHIRYTQKEKINISNQCIQTIQKVYTNPRRLDYDLRFVFELVLLRYPLDEINIPTDLLNHIRKINYCHSIDRWQTIWKIHDEPSLYTLHAWFVPYDQRVSKNRTWRTINSDS